MYGIFINSRKVPYARLIVDGVKTYETRTKNTLRPLVGRRVAIIETGKGSPMIVGFATIDGADYLGHDAFDSIRSLTCIPAGSKYDDDGKGKWCYKLTDPCPLCDVVPLPFDAIRHGRVWCEFDKKCLYKQNPVVYYAQRSYTSGNWYVLRTLLDVGNIYSNEWAMQDDRLFFDSEEACKKYWENCFAGNIKFE